MHEQPDQTPSSKTIENPFAAQLNSQRSSGKRAFVSAMKTLLFVSVALAAIVTTNHYTQDWLLSRQTAGYDQLNSAERSVRLVEIAQFGPRSLPNLVNALGDSESSVARTAWRLIQDQQESWELLKPSTAATHHTLLLQHVHDVAEGLTGERTTWANQLVQASLAKLRTDNNFLTSNVQALADLTLERLSISQPARANTNAAPDQRVTLNQNTSSIRIVSQTDPLPIETTWIEAETIQEPEPIPSEDPGPNTVAVNDNRIALKVVDPNAVALQPMEEEGSALTSTSIKAAPDEARPSDAENMLATSSLETMDSQTVVRLLAHDDQNVRTDASLQLGARGWTQPQIELAGRLVSGSIEGRLQVIDHLAAATEIDPRKWLLFLLGDADVRIRRRVVAILATFDDEAITEHLQEHQLGENDPEIRTLIARQVSPANVYRR